ncbi:coiled-coil domain-containing protein [Streptomyces niveiscabiei]|uniref:Chromosome partition protein Smc n=1 Tax=Streptomyces niveiscabiei TaxID=164115 RepID=A0ABW9I1S9_9ACTN
MSPRPPQRAPKGRNRDRDDRRAVLDVLLARAQRGALSAAEGALLAQHVREEQRLGDENRLAMAGTTQALARHREAADASLVEVEERAADAERKLSDSETLGHRLLQRAENAEQQLAAVRAQLHTARTGRQDAERALDRIRQAQSLGEALGVVAQFDGIDPTAARTHARILDRANTVEARLAEQQREHDVALAVAKQRATKLERATEQHRRALAAILARPSGTPVGELTEYAAAALNRSGERILAAEQRATRYRTAWLAARRDRKADRAAMAAELPDVVAGRLARAAGLTTAEATGHMRRAVAAGIPAAQFVTTTEQPR